jgi:hypothetical protein
MASWEMSVGIEVTEAGRVSPDASGVLGDVSTAFVISRSLVHVVHKCERKKETVVQRADSADIVSLGMLRKYARSAAMMLTLIIQASDSV